MKHSYMNSDGEVIAADTLEQAARYHDCTLGSATTPNLGDWQECDDDAEHAITVDENVVTKTFKNWASEHAEPGYVSSTYA